MRRVIAKCRGLSRSERGLAAVEFAILAPFLVLGVFTAVDLGLAVHQRMTMDHVLRSGAQVAMIDPGEQEVRNALQSTASKNFTAGESDLSTGTESWRVTYTAESTPLTLSVERYCTCPNAQGIQVTCSTICEGTVPTYIYYKLDASTQFEGVVIPEFGLESTVEVQVR